jgi:hypothetical protein
VLTARALPWLFYAQRLEMIEMLEMVEIVEMLEMVEMLAKSRYPPSTISIISCDGRGLRGEQRHLGVCTPLTVDLEQVRTGASRESSGKARRSQMVEAALREVKFTCSLPDTSVSL